MKRILVPTDFSKSADKAAQYALQIANKSGAEIILLHVCSLPDPVYAESEAAMQDYNRVRSAELNAQLRRYSGSLDTVPGVQVKTLLAEGDTVEVIAQKAEDFGADLIVMGTRGANGLKAMIMGTRTAAVLKATKVPVVAVPEAFEGAPPANMLLALQKEEKASLLEPVLKLKQLFGARLRTIQFTDNDAEAATMLEDAHRLATATGKVEEAIGSGPIPHDNIGGDDFREAINSYVEANKVDLLVMVSHRKNLLQRLFGSSMTRKMAYHTRIPLMALHE